jgi:hypothetical protein
MQRATKCVFGPLIRLLAQLNIRFLKDLPLIWVRINKSREVIGSIVEDVSVSSRVCGCEEEICDFVGNLFVVFHLDYKLADALEGSTPDQFGGLVFDEGVVELTEVFFFVDLRADLGYVGDLLSTGFTDAIVLVLTQVNVEFVDVLTEILGLHDLRNAQDTF